MSSRDPQGTAAASSAWKQERRHLRIRAPIDDLSPRFRITFSTVEISVADVFVKENESEIARSGLPPEHADLSGLDQEDVLSGMEHTKDVLRIQIEYRNKVARCALAGAREYEDVVLGIHQGRVCLHQYLADCCCACPPQTLDGIRRASETADVVA